MTIATTLKKLAKALPNWEMWPVGMGCPKCARVVISYLEDDCTFDFPWLIKDRRKYVQAWEAAMIKGIIVAAKEYEKRTKSKKRKKRV